MDRRRFQALEIVASYLRRWEIEISYREQKQTLLGGALSRYDVRFVFKIPK